MTARLLSRSLLPEGTYLAAILACVLAGPIQGADVAAKVGPDSISVAEVEHEMQKALQDRKIEAEDKEILQAQTLGLLINRQLVIQYLQKMKLGATEQEIDATLERISTQLKRRDLTLDEHLKQLGLTKTEFRRALAWEAGWPKYLASKLKPENIRTYFDQHHYDFDGTQTPRGPSALEGRQARRRSGGAEGGRSGGRPARPDSRQEAHLRRDRQEAQPGPHRGRWRRYRADLASRADARSVQRGGVRVGAGRRPASR